jgi:hypothetical protein
MKALLIILASLTSFSLYACPMEQVDHTQREGIRLDMATDPNPTGITHQHSEHHEPLFAAAEKSNSTAAPESTKKGLMGR